MKISIKLSAVLLILIIALLISGYLYYQNGSKIIKSMVLNHLKSVASIQHARLEAIYKQNNERFQLVASRTQLRLSLQKYLSDKNNKHIYKINRILKDAQNSIHSINKIDLLDFNGNVIASTDTTQIGFKTTYQIDDLYVKNDLKKVLSNFKLNDSGAIKLYLSGSLSINDNVLGLMVIESDVGTIMDAVQDYSGLGKSGETVLAKKEHDGTIRFLMPTRFDSLAALKRIILSNRKNVAIAQSFSEESRVLSNCIDYRNEPIWAVTQYVEDAEWGIAVKRDVAESLAPLSQLQRTLFISILIIVSIIIILLFFLFRSITIPITKLTNIAKAVSNDDTSDFSVNIKSKNEIGILADSFNMMTLKLTDTNRVLTDKVNELNLEIQEREKIEDALRNSEFKFKELFNLSPIGLALCKMDGKLISVNPMYAKIIGYSIDETLNLSYWDITPKKYTDDEKVQLELLHRTKKYGPYEKEYRHKDGHLVPVRLNGKIVNWGGEDFIWSSVEDISKLKDSEKEKDSLFEQLHQSHKMEAIGTLAGGIAHDFNNILAAIIGFSELALEDASNNEELQDKLNQIINASDRAKNLVSQILSYSRKERLEQKPIQINKIVNDVYNLVRASTPTTVSITKDIEQSPSLIVGNETQIHQVILNIVTNAVQAMSEFGGVLTINLKETILNAEDFRNNEDIKPGKYMSLKISDNGIGITPEILDRIFDPYFTTKEMGKGSGMGLAVVSGIVQSHDGIIRIESVPGKGTMFNVLFPKIDNSEVDNLSEESSLSSGNERILIVDDEKNIVDVLQLSLERLGYKVIATYSSLKALNIFREAPDSIDLVFTDYTMPQMTGEILAEKIFEIKPDMPIIICSGYSSKMDSKRASELGIKAFLPKPVSRKDLTKIIRQVLDENKNN